MRHRVGGSKLNRDTKARKALFKNLISSLIIYERIKTTSAKASAVRGLMDKLVSKAKTGSLSARRMIAAFLPDKMAVEKMMDVIGPRFKDRTSGFTRTTKLGRRKGDAAEIVQIEFLADGQKAVTEPVEEKKQIKKPAVKKIEVKPKKAEKKS